MKRDTDIEATIVGKFVVMSPLLDERARRLWAAAESVAIGYGGDSVVSSATSIGEVYFTASARCGMTETPLRTQRRTPIALYGLGREP